MMYVWRPGESSTPRVITRRAEIFIELRLPRPVPQGARGPRRTDKAAACRRKHARRLALQQRQLYRWLHCGPRRRRCDPSSLKLRKGCEACLNNNCTAQRLVLRVISRVQLAG